MAHGLLVQSLGLGVQTLPTQGDAPVASGNICRPGSLSNFLVEVSYSRSYYEQDLEFSGAIGDTGISASAGVLLGISSVGTGVDWTGISTVSEGSPDWTGVSALIKELPIEQVSVVEKSSRDKHENRW